MTDDTIRDALTAQYLASFQMLRDTINACSDELWLDRTPRNAFWQIAYHTIYFGHLYAQVDLESWLPWAEHQSDVQHDDAIAGPPDPASDRPLIPEPYTRDQALRYCDFCMDSIGGWIGKLDLERQDCGFSWYRTPKFEHQLISIRHIQHGAAQLADRLRMALDQGTRWRASGKAPAA